MPVDFNGLFLQTRPPQVDFSPIVQGGAALGRGYEQAGQAIGQGLVDRARLQQAAKLQAAHLAEDKRQFDIADATRKMLAQAQQEIERSRERQQTIREFDQQQHQNVMEQQAAERIKLEDQRYQTLQQQNQRMQDRQDMEARRRSDIAAVAQAHHEAYAAGSMKLADQMKDRGDLTDQEHALLSLDLQSGDPTLVHQAATTMMSRDKDIRQKARDENMKKSGGKELLNALNDQVQKLKDAGLPIDPEKFLEAQGKAIDYTGSYSTGPALAAEFRALHNEMRTFGRPKSGATQAPKLVIPGSPSVPDVLGLSKGGNFDEMTPNQQAGLLAAGREYAQRHDPRWKIAEQAAQFKIIEAQTAKKPAAEKDARAEGDRALQNLALEKANDIALANGWHARTDGVPQEAGGATQSTQAPQQAAAPVTRESLKARAIAEHWTKEQYVKALSDAGIQ